MGGGEAPKIRHRLIQPSLQDALSPVNVSRVSRGRDLQEPGALDIFNGSNDGALRIVVRHGFQ